MEILPEPSRVFNPSALQRDVVHDQDDEQEQEDAEEARAIAEGIDNQLRELDDLDLEEEDDEEDGVSGFHHQPIPTQPSPQQHIMQRQNLGVAPTVPLPGDLDRQFKDKMFLAGNDPGGGGVAGQNDMLQILYDARGHQIAKLQKELSLAEAGQEQELRTLRHQLALAKGEKESLTARTEHLTDVADGQVEENRKLRDTVSGLERKLELALKAKEDAVAQLEDSNLMVQTLQSQVIDMQKNDAVLRARHQHEEAVRSLRERHELEVFRFNQEIDSGKMRVKSKDNEIDALRSQLTKSERERDNLLVEKSEVIRGLQERLDATQKRLAQSIAEVGSQGYNNVKAMHQRFQQDQEKYANDVVAFSNEIQTLEVKLKSRDSELTDTKKKLGEVTEKYSDLKRRARHYKAHCQSKQERLNAQLKRSEDEYRSKLLGLKAKMEARDEQIEAELREMASDFKHELARALRLASNSDDDGENGENFEPGGVVGSNPHRGEEDVDDFVISESSSRQQLRQLPPQHIHSKQHKSKEPPQQSTPNRQSRPHQYHQQNEQQHRPLQEMFESAKRNVRHELKRPGDQ